jgi:hypothetical protein
MTTVPPIWTAMIARDVGSMRSILTARPASANDPHPRSGELPFDAALYWGYLPECQLLHEFNAVHTTSALGSAVMLANMDLVNWVYTNIDSNVNDPAIPQAIFASTKTTDDHKFVAFKFMMDKGSNPAPYMFNAVLLSPLATKYLVENNLLDLTATTDDGKTILDYVELRNLPHPFTLYLKGDRSNDLFYAVTKNDLQTLSTTTKNVNTPLSNFVGSPYLYALSIGNVEAARVLLTKGAVPTFKTPLGKNAVASAVLSNSVDSVNFARDNSPESDIDVVYRNKRNAQVTVLQSAVSTYVSTPVLTSLLVPRNGKRGANPNLLCDGVPPVGTIGYCVQAPTSPFTNHVEMFKALVDAGADVDSYNAVMRRSPRDFYVSQLRNIKAPQTVIDDVPTYKRK